jgi:hypothetical protein
MKSSRRQTHYRAAEGTQVQEGLVAAVNTTSSPQDPQILRGIRCQVLVCREESVTGNTSQRHCRLETKTRQIAQKDIRVFETQDSGTEKWFSGGGGGVVKSVSYITTLFNKPHGAMKS